MSKITITAPSEKVDSIRRWFSKSGVTVEIGEAPDTLGGVAFGNPTSLTIATTSAVVEGVNTYTSVYGGEAPVMTAEQATAFGGATAGETTFISVSYKTGLPGAAKRKVGWVDSADAQLGGDATERELDPSGIQLTVLGLTGPGTIATGRKFYRAEVLDAEGKAVAVYVFDFSGVATPAATETAEAAKAVPVAETIGDGAAAPVPSKSKKKAA